MNCGVNMANQRYNWVNQMVKQRMKKRNKAKKLIDILDEMNNKEDNILYKFNKLLKLIVSFNPSIDNVELRWVEERINRINQNVKLITKRDLKNANTIYRKWNVK